ncbi:MAG TPA: hypothetical protein VFE57_05155 [Cyclobacteriaceae bacterium]|jgi:hypothetical protein|nr:hypothetical protein [Cyclobacteriaceae bacterium]
MKKEQPKKPKKESPKKPPETEEKNEPFNFGGLPQRDLKKNLGCG